MIKSIINISIIAGVGLIFSTCSNNSPVSLNDDKSTEVAGLPVNSMTIANVFSLGMYGASSKFVCAENEGQSPLMANRTAVGYWEQYAVIYNGIDNTYSFQSLANLKYVTAANGESQPLIASGTSITASEKFNLVRVLQPDGYKIQSKMNGKWLCTASDNKIYPVGTVYSNTYNVYMNKLMGFSASTSANNAYIWNCFTLDNGNELGVEYRIRSQGTPTPGTTVALYIDNQYKGSCGFTGYAVFRVLSPDTGMNFHNIRIQFNQACTLDYVTCEPYLSTR